MHYQIVTWNIDKEYISLLSPILTEDGIGIIEATNQDMLTEHLTGKNAHLILADVFSDCGASLDLSQWTTKDDFVIGNGFSQIAALHSMTNIPLLLLTSRDDLMTKITALDTGADDFVSSHINVLELHARINALLRRSYRLSELFEQENRIYTIRELKLNDISKKTYVGGDEKKLTPIEYRILRLLISRQGRPVSSREIYKTIWKMNAVNTDNVVAVHMRHLRKKIEKQPEKPSYLKVVRGMGYMIV